MSAPDTTVTPEHSTFEGEPYQLRPAWLFDLELETAPPTPIPAGPAGTRFIIPITGGRASGPDLRATVVPPAGDWVTVAPDGTNRLDVRATLVTDDGATILVTALGVAQMGDGGPIIRAAQRYETGDDRYSWLNTLVGAAAGQLVEQVVRLRVHRLG